jgi:hypothetical protein
MYELNLPLDPLAGFVGGLSCVLGIPLVLHEYGPRQLVSPNMDCAGSRLPSLCFYGLMTHRAFWRTLPLGFSCSRYGN